MVNPHIPHQIVMVSRTHWIIVWKWSIHCASLSAMLKPLCSKQIQNCMKSTSVTKAATIKQKYKWSHTPQLQVPLPSIIIWKVKYPLRFLSTILDSLHTNMNYDLVEKHLCNQGSHYEKYRQFPLLMQRKPSCATTKLTHFDIRMEYKLRRTLVSPWRMHCAYCSMLKGTSWA